MSKGYKHIKAQQRLFNIFALYFNVVIPEFPMPCPNPQFTLGDHKARSLKTYYFDIFAESPKMEKIQSLKYPTIGIEVDGEYGHKKTKRQHKRDNARTQIITEYYNGVFIIRYDSEQIVGKGFADPFKNWDFRPPFTQEEIFRHIELVPKKISVS